MSVPSSMPDSESGVDNGGRDVLAWRPWLRPSLGLAAGAALVAVVVVLVTGFLWPGWFHGASTVSAACPLLAASDVEQAFGVSDLSNEEQSPIYDHGTAVHICTYGPSNGAAEVALSVADYPPTISAEQLVRNTASSGVDFRPTTGIGEFAAFVDGIGHNENLSLAAATRVDQHLRLVVVSANYQLNPLDGELSSLVKSAVSAS